MKADAEKRIKGLLCFIYGDRTADEIYPKLMVILEEAFPNREGVSPEKPGGKSAVSAGDALLIVYGDMLAAEENAAGGTEPRGRPSAEAGGGEETGLARLARFLEKWNRGSFSYLHILPFHPYSSDDGFSVIDYREVDRRFGTWDDIDVLGRQFKPVFDFVLNHGSVESPWFKAFLAGDGEYAGWYITRPADYDYSTVVRPRTHPLLSPFTRKDGSKIHVWTTFSADQADYDFSNPRLLLEFVKIFLEYARRGAKIVRLDAIAYLWKEDGTPCLHHPKTHGVVKLFRAIIDALGLDMLILTETNVPHEQNISYFGGRDEAHMVYNFALPPLVLHAAISGDAGPLRAWARSLPGPEQGCLFLNFLASHDGVGLSPARGLVDEAAFAATLREAQNRGGLISYKASPEGPVPYELNCAYPGLTAPESLGPPELRARAFLATQGTLLALSGLPAVYFHSWIGSEAWKEGPELLGFNRAINREKPPIDRVEKELDNPGSFRSLVYRGFNRLLEFRRHEAAFNPDIPQTVLDAEGAVFALLRGPDQRGRRVLCAQNLASSPAALKLPPGLSLPPELCPPALGSAATDSGLRPPGDCPPGDSPGAISLEPWETRWIAFGGGGETRSL
jgi:sucrose phosphorylase